ncbi:hypothetical protein IE982_06460 [Enterobacter hormaechei]|nr:hypothetical protein [Enterobacter hormaechei]
MTAEIFMQQLPAKQAEFSGSSKKSLNWPMRTAYGKGLELKLTANKLQWRHRYTFEGKPREYVIGYYPLFDFHKAADQHRLNMQSITSGTDPLVERQQGKAAAKEKAIKQAQDVITGVTYSGSIPAMMHLPSLKIALRLTPFTYGIVISKSTLAV